MQPNKQVKVSHPTCQQRVLLHGYDHVQYDYAMAAQDAQHFITVQLKKYNLRLQEFDQGYILYTCIMSCLRPLNKNHGRLE